MVKAKPSGVLGQLLKQVHASAKLLTQTSLIYAALKKNSSSLKLSIDELFKNKVGESKDF